ncbi:MAG TPA: hypothetical protein VEU47_03285 [Candidatus Cybelea sp.]|nr:hypothetical protein [Candidatus Cybelea sp.]
MAADTDTTLRLHERRDAADLVRRRPFGLVRLPHGDAELAQALAHWSARRTGGQLPRPADVDAGALAGFGVALQFVDVTPGAAEHYRLGRRVGRGPFEPDDFELGMRLGQIVPPALAQAVAEDYHVVASKGLPAYHHVTIRLGPVPLQYGRLILPLATDGRRVSALIVCTRLHPGP